MTTPNDLCILMIHAHPDDECLATGGVLARYNAEGIRTVLVIATGGEEGEIVVPELNTPENKARLKEIRDGELACSVQHLGVSELLRLGYRDSGMVDTPGNDHPESFHQADKAEVLRRVVTIVRRVRPQVLVSYDERGGYGHPDHIACHLATVAAFEAAGDATRFPEAGEPWQPLKLYYTAFPRQEIYRAWEVMRERGLPTPLDEPEFDVTRFTTPDERVTTTIAIHAYLAQKRAAIACHLTQMGAEGPFVSIPEDIGMELFGVEHFIRVQSLVPLPQTGAREDDLFAGVQ
jgi:N-acetyl-1-D-myo-inositol-2-amino-2-deoxy-alpha-D-glucopyranoside deacetylase